MNAPRRLAAIPLLLALCSAVSAQVVINEAMSDNKNSLVDNFGNSSDWIELYNTGAASVNLGGWALTDDPARVQKWVFPSTNLLGKGFLIVFASGTNRAVAGQPLHADFSLAAGGEYLALLRPDGSVASELNPAPPLRADFSFGTAQTVVTNRLVAAGASGKMLVPQSSTPATWMNRTFNDGGWAPAQTGVGYETAVAGFAVYNYVGNSGICSLQAALDTIDNPGLQAAVYAENAPVINYVNTGGGSHFGNDASFPGLVINQDQENFTIKATATVYIPTAGAWTFGVNSDDGFQLTVGGQTVSYPDPRGPADTLGTLSFPAPGNYDLELVFYECGGGSEVELFAAQGSYGGFDPSAFRLVGDVANGGLAVSAPVVSGGGGGSSYRTLIASDVQAQMKDVSASLYLRLPFNVADPAALQSLSLEIRYDDGFVAYLNGTEVARRNAPATPAWNSAATASHPNYQARVAETINLTDRLNLLVAGNNVLAIHGLNQAASDTDFLILPELIDYRVTTGGGRYFSGGTPGSHNGLGYAGFVAAPKHNVERGFFTNGFSLALSSATPGAAIYYTTNGTTPSATNGYLYSGPLTIAGTTVVRAGAYLADYYPSETRAHSYVFPNDVIRQSPTGTPPPGWPANWGNGVATDYGMDPDIVNSPTYSPEMVHAMVSLPSFSIVTDLKHLFDPATGIYANPGGDGREWERPVSLELIYPDGTKGFQVNAGLRIRGGYSRSGDNPKHGFRLFFRQEYGDSKLNYPLFARQNGVETFDSVDLRTFQNYSWSFEGDYRFIGMRDQWLRDTQLAQGHQGERGDYYHLYINGQYWGIYNTAERPEASYGESYFGGTADDYDVIKVDTSAGYTIHATDGTMDAWARLWQAAVTGFGSDVDYYKVQGLNVDGTLNPGYENLVDIDNLIDYSLLTFFTGNIDAPVSAFLSDSNPNNMYCVRNRTGKFGGFRFFSHDGEHTLHHESTLSNDELNRNRLGPFPAGDPNQQGGGAFARSNPQYLFSRFTDNTEFRVRLADRIQKQFFDGGVFTTESCRARFLARSNEIYHAVAAESARWGDSKRATPRNRNTDWVTEVNRVHNSYFVQRPGIVLNQLRNAGWFPSVAAPAFSQNGGNISQGYLLTMSAPAGTIYFTRDGSDPRLRGGAISASATPYSGPITLTQSSIVKARAYSGGVWSPLREATFYVIRNFTTLLLTEIMYNPAGTPTVDGDEFEFLELKNVSATSLELSGLQFTNGITYRFPVGSFLAPGKHLILASNPQAFSNRYPAVQVSGTYTGKLSNGGERLTLVHVDGKPLFSFAYDTSSPWPPAADGDGFSLVPINPNANPDPGSAANWRASSAIGGSPGADDPSLNLPQIIITEVLTHTDPPTLDTVELYNPHTTNANIAGWYLTDNRNVPRKYKFPLNSFVPAQGYAYVNESAWYVPGSTNSFLLDSHGEEIYLFSADANGNLTGYSDGFAFGAAANGVSFGRYTISTGEPQYPAQKTLTLGGTNSGPRVGPVVIDEIMYHPPVGGDEFIELRSLTNATVKLYDPEFPTNTWRLNGAGFSFPRNSEIPPNGIVLLVAGDTNLFRSKYSVPPAVQIFGPFAGNLQGNGEELSLQWPDKPDLDTNTGQIFIPYIDMDVVRYSDSLPWPTNADGWGSSLERLNSMAYGNDPTNWRASPGLPSPGLVNTGNRLPLVNAGGDQVLDIASVPFNVQLSGTVTDDGLPNPPAAVTSLWSQVSGPAPGWFANAASRTTTVSLPGVGSYVFRITANDGEYSSYDEVAITLRRTPSPTTLVAKGAVWKYLDTGANLGTTWTSRTFNDNSWKSGPAPLGYDRYSDFGWPKTTNSFGPDPNNKYITTYYRRSFQVASPAGVTTLAVSVQRDDGAVVHLNGTPVFTNNMPTDRVIDYQTTAASTVGNQDEAAFYTMPISPTLLVQGSNTLAVEIHQVNNTSSDIIFDLELTGESFPANQAPTAQAGPDLAIQLPSTAALNGSVSDDALPVPPGVLAVQWSKVSGPGAVTFSPPSAPKTVASFSIPGSYVLRLAANDGLSSSQDDVAVNVTGIAAPVRIDYAEFRGTDPVMFVIGFNAMAGATYSVQFCSDLTTRAWTKLGDVAAQEVSGPVEVVDSAAIGQTARFYRVVSPQLP